MIAVLMSYAAMGRTGISAPSCLTHLIKSGELPSIDFDKRGVRPGSRCFVVA